MASTEPSESQPTQTDTIRPFPPPTDEVIALQGLFGFVHCDRNDSLPHQSSELRFYTTSEQDAVDCPLEQLFAIHSPLFYPRHSWPHQPLPFRYDSNTADDMSCGVHMLDYNTAVNLHPAMDWRSHVHDIREYLSRNITRRMTLGSGLLAMCRILGRGIEHSVQLLPALFSLPNDSEEAVDAFKKKIGEANTRLLAAYETKDMPIIPGYHGIRRRKPMASEAGTTNYVEPLREAMAYRRIVVGIIHFPEISHYALFMFDRACGDLYYVDTIQLGRVDRAHDFIIAWRQMLIMLGHPLPFHYIVVPCTQQRENWECGHLIVVMLTLLLRVRAGPSAHELCCRNSGGPNPSHDDNGMYAEPDPWATSTSIGQLQLPIRDWCIAQAGEKAARYGLYIHRALRLAQSIAANELGHETSNGAHVIVHNSTGETVLPTSKRWDLSYIASPFKMAESTNSQSATKPWGTLCLVEAPADAPAPVVDNPAQSIAAPTLHEVVLGKPLRTTPPSQPLHQSGLVVPWFWNMGLHLPFKPMPATKGQSGMVLTFSRRFRPPTAHPSSLSIRW